MIGATSAILRIDRVILQLGGGSAGPNSVSFPIRDREHRIVGVVLRFPEVPPVEVALIDRPDQPSHGAGEAACTPMAAALANAVFDATGVRLRRVPFTAAHVKAALA